MAMEPAQPEEAAAENKAQADIQKGQPQNTETVVAEEQSGFSRGSVVRSIFTSAIDQREPVDKLKALNQEQSKIFYFSELRDMSGQTAKHRWQYNGEVVAEVDFNVGGPRWRVWSSKSLNPTAPGEWKVSVLNGAGEIIAEELISVPEAAPTSPVTDPSTSSDIPVAPPAPVTATQ